MDPEFLCRSGYAIGGVDIVSAASPGCGNDPDEYIWIAYEGSLPAASGYSDSIPTGWCVLENHKYKQAYRLLETASDSNWIMSVPNAFSGGYSGQLEKHFKAIPHENGQVAILNSAADQILEMKYDTSVFVNKFVAGSPKNSKASKSLFTFEEVDAGPGEENSILNFTTQII